MEKAGYEIDPHNRIILKEGKESELHRVRKVLDGRFRISKNNELTYHVKAPLQPGEDIPHQIKLKGKWSLNKNHDLVLVLDKWKRQTFGDRLTLRGYIIDVRSNSLVFSITTSRGPRQESIYMIELIGSWQADKFNRLTFKVNRGESKYDILIFDGIWEVNRNHRVTYRYEKEGLARGLKKTHTLVFKGHWDITEKARVSYALDANTDSAFIFRTSLGIFKENYIKYELGIGLSHLTKPTKRTIIIFGEWKFRRDMKLLFEVEYEARKVHCITFGSEVKLLYKDMILFRLKDDIYNNDIGISLEVSRSILKGDGTAFLELRRSRKETAALAGAAWRW